MGADLLRWLASNPWLGLRTPPAGRPWWLWTVIAATLAVAFWYGRASGFLHFSPLHSRMAPLLPATLLIMPSLAEEIIFRGVLIPRDILSKGWGWASAYLLGSTLVYVLWHPFYARTLNPKAAPVFLDGRFLLIVVALGLICGLGYIVTRSLWVPVLTHWAVVMVWVFLFSGRNMILD